MNDRIIGIIGKGRNSKVCLVEHDGELVARKRIKITPRSLENIEKEVNILKELKHRNIIIYKDSKVVESENKFYIYTEYLEYGDLWNIMYE